MRDKNQRFCDWLKYKYDLILLLVNCRAIDWFYKMNKLLNKVL